jgi:glycerol kinase
MIVNTGETPSLSRNRLLTTIGYRLNGKPTYAMEGSIFVAGATVQWLRDGLNLFADALGNRSACAENPQWSQRLLGSRFYWFRCPALGSKSARCDFLA